MVLSVFLFSSVSLSTITIEVNISYLWNGQHATRDSMLGRFKVGKNSSGSIHEGVGNWDVFQAIGKRGFLIMVS